MSIIPHKIQPRRVIKALPKNATIHFDKAKDNTVQHIINIDSRTRDLNKHSNPNDYRYRLNNPLKNISKLELVTAEIPHSDFIINEYNNNIDLIDNGVSETITLTVGDYDITTLGDEVEDRLNDLTNGTTYTVVFSNGKYTITGDQNFSLLWSSGTNADFIQTSGDGYNIGHLSKGNGPRQILGFTLADTAFGLTATSQNKINLGGENYVILELGNDILHQDMDDSTGNDAFGKIQFSYGVNDVQFYTEDKYDISKTYDPPLHKLEFLRVKFKVYGGRLYNFRGHEHSFMLRVTTLE